jgi:Ca-activated chloride channel family protein
VRKTLGILIAVGALSCGNKRRAEDQPDLSSSGLAPVTLRVAYSSEKKAWFDQAVPAFAATQPKTPSGHPIVVEAKSFGSGEAQTAILDGSFRAHVYSPASSAYLALLNQAWLSGQTPHQKPLAGAAEPLVLSPIVIAMWKPMAEALGWPGKDIGWKDLIKVSKDPQGWGALGHPEWGAFKLGHTHPEYSNSGLLAVLAEAFAGTGKTRGVTRDDLQANATKQYLGAIEDAVVHYGKSTGLFTDQMLERGPGYMSACVTYENLVIDSYAHPGKSPFPLVAVYPVEGTFWSDHPYAVLDADWVGSDERAAAGAFLAFLKTKPMQDQALALGFRSADPKIATASPIDAAHGVDPKQPQTLLEVPDASVLETLLAVWREEKKTSDVMIVFDHSGSMHGEPLKGAVAGARMFVDDLGERDSASILFFNDLVPPPPPPRPLGKGSADFRGELEHQLDGAFAAGGTKLYDAIARSYDFMHARAQKEPGRIHALVVMTDGKDEGSTLRLEQLEQRFSHEDAAPVKIFTIAYGDEADPHPLEDIANAAQGTSVRGSTDTIVQVYKDLSAFF